MVSWAIWIVCVGAAVPAIRAVSHYQYTPYNLTYTRTDCVSPADHSTCKRENLTQSNLQTRSCETGWGGCNCEIPICNTSCTGDTVCLAPNQCGCLKTGISANTSCPYTQCQNGRDCYPGTCSSNGTYCICPAGFAGDNCQSITSTPSIFTCTVKVYDTSFNLIRQAYCAGSGYSSSINWLPNVDINQIQAEWQALYVNIVNLPGSAVNYVNPTTIGVNATRFEVSINTATSTVVQNCYRPDLPCDVNVRWIDRGFPSPVHGMTFRATVFAKLGGQKQITRTPAGVFFNPLPPPLPFYGAEATRGVLFGFDVRPPVHCLTNGTPADCPYFPIYLYQDITSNPYIQPKFYNWTDDGSGISAFQINVYTMGISGVLLENVGGPIVTQTVDPIKNDAIFSVRDPGIYSIELTVLDKAGNKVRARKLFIYNPTSTITTYPSFPVYLKQADPPTYKWLTHFDDPKNGGNNSLTVTWAYHFSSSAQYNAWLSAAAKPWDPSVGIDDIYKGIYGRRSIFPLPQTSGIASYALAYYVGQYGGGKGLTPYNWVTLNATVNSYDLPINYSLADGNTIVVWIQCVDASVSSVNETIVIEVDRTPPEVKQHTYSLKTGVYGTQTSVIVTVVDRVSGISTISYKIYATINDIDTQVLPQRRAAPPATSTRSKRSVPAEEFCLTGDSTCYCTPQGDCFNYNQTIEIDNCVINRLAGMYLMIRYTVVNYANLATTEEIELGVLSSSDMPCQTVSGSSSETSSTSASTIKARRTTPMVTTHRRT